MTIWSHDCVSRATAGAFTPNFYYQGFYLAPPFVGLYPGIAPWWGPFPYDPLYYGQYYPYWPYAYPTREIVEQAIPEGVLEVNGRLTGFLYFQSLNPSWREVTFEADLVDAKTGESFGKISMPFEYPTRAHPVSQREGVDGNPG